MGLQCCYQYLESCFVNPKKRGKACIPLQTGLRRLQNQMLRVATKPPVVDNTTDEVLDRSIVFDFGLPMAVFHDHDETHTHMTL